MKISYSLPIRLFIMTFLVFPAWAHAQSGDPEPVKMQEHRQTGSPEFKITTVSSRNDTVSGGDALIRIEVSPLVPFDRVAVALNGKDIISAFRPADQRSLLGFVTGLRPGDNTVTVTHRNGDLETSLVITDWPIEGPIFSGPHEKPYICMTESFVLPITGGNLGKALDDNCSIAMRIDYIYRTTNNQFKPLPNPSVHPSDLAYTTTNEGRKVPYIVRIETGTVNRAIYQLSILDDPATGQPIDPWNRAAGWNGRLFYTFGGGCPGGWYIQGKQTGGVLDDYMLSQGFAIASSTKNVQSNNCSDIVSAETAMMVKERFVKHYGVPAYTIGWGSSGGSEQLHSIGDNYPGIVDGVIVGSSFPDVAFGAINMQGFGTRLLHHYFTELATEKWTQEQEIAVAGVAMHETLVAQATREDRINPRGACSEAIPQALLYDPVKNPRGARCTTYDHTIVAWGRDPKTGFARRPLDNVGVQYGLKTLNAGVITKAQFLDLNEKIGGVDIDANFTRDRTAGDRIAARHGYETGRFMNGGGGLAATPIIDYRAYADFRPGDVHMRFHSFSTRARLIEQNGNADNHVMLVEDYTYGGFSTKSPLLREAIRKMDMWLSNVAKDRSEAPRAAKVVEAKPSDLQDGCVAPGGKRINERQVYQQGECDKYFPSHANPYLVAGMPLSNNVAICQLKPVDPAEYKVKFTPEELDRLRRIFHGGVCDYSKPSVERHPLMGTWLSYAR